MTDNTTPRPWGLTPSFEGRQFLANREHGYVPLQAPALGEPEHATAIANAALIVRAVNAHDDLVATLTSIQHGLDRALTRGLRTQEAAIHVRLCESAARTALAKARA